MTDVISSTSPMYTTTIADHNHGNNNHNQYDTQKILESIGNAALHELNALGVTAKAISDNAQVTNQNVGHEGRNLDNKVADVERASAAQTTSILLDNTSTRFQSAAEGRNTDNKISDSERYSAAQFTDAAVDRAHSFAAVALAAAQNKSDIVQSFSDKLAALTVEVINQGSRGRELLLSENLAELRSKACCCNKA